MVRGGRTGNVFIGSDLFPLPLPALEAETKETGLSKAAGCRCVVLGRGWAGAFGLSRGGSGFTNGCWASDGAGRWELEEDDDSPPDCKALGAWPPWEK